MLEKKIAAMVSKEELVEVMSIKEQVVLICALWARRNGDPPEVRGGLSQRSDNAIARLKKKGLLQKDEEQDDSKWTYLALTTKGERVAAQVKELWG